MTHRHVVSSLTADLTAVIFASIKCETLHSGIVGEKYVAYMLWSFGGLGAEGGTL